MEEQSQSATARMRRETAPSQLAMLLMPEGLRALRSAARARLLSPMGRRSAMPRGLQARVRVHLVSWPPHRGCHPRPSAFNRRRPTLMQLRSVRSRVPLPSKALLSAGAASRQLRMQRPWAIRPMRPGLGPQRSVLEARRRMFKPRLLVSQPLQRLRTPRQWGMIATQRARIRPRWVLEQLQKRSARRLPASVAGRLAKIQLLRVDQAERLDGRALRSAPPPRRRLRTRLPWASAPWLAAQARRRWVTQA